ncbi:putative Actin [Blattamonas nauphoetae]|uniref:Actin n=1 Tax=Blattamonas nauphoetae TaxID=2049346 RepID=A0ABQ9XAI9_9EUKA|nr:putative Actin [Blattamonas nauphoetae]
MESKTFPLPNQSIILDFGSSLIKSGFSGQSTPSNFSPNIVGYFKNDDLIELRDNDSRAFLTSNIAMSHKGQLKLHHPVNRGRIEDWNELEGVLDNIFQQELNVDVASRNVMIIEQPFNPRQNRIKLSEYLIETCQSSGVYFVSSALCSLYASGVTTGIVVDSGDGCTTVTPIIQNRILTHSIQRSEYGGRDITSRLRHLLRLEGHSFTSSSEFEVVREIKEELCFISSDIQADRGKQHTNSFAATFTLPDKSEITLNGERFQAPELLFDPSLVGSEEAGVDEMFENALSLSDVDCRPVLCQTISLSGGSTLFPGFPQRFLNNIRTRLQPQFPLKIKAPKDRLLSPWIGASVLASQEIMSNLWITPQRYHSEGPNLFYQE